MEVPGYLLRLMITKMTKYSLKIKTFTSNNPCLVYKQLQHQVRAQNGATTHQESNRRVHNANKITTLSIAITEIET